MPEPSEPTRRAFLTGEAAADAIQRRADGQQSDDVAPCISSVREPLIEIGRRAMACQFQVLLNAGDGPAAQEAALEALDLVDQVEDQLTVYRHRSEVSQLNAVAATRPVKVDDCLFELIQRSWLLYRETEGAFDITAGPLVKLWGFYRREGRVPGDQELADVLDRTGSEWIELDADAGTVHFLREGVELNFGAIGKGYALDRAAERLREAGVRDFLFHGGNSSVLAVGSRAGVAGGGWIVGVGHPLRPDVRLAEIRLRDRAIGTSGTGTQHFYHQGRRFGHIIDPRTGCPAEGNYSVSVLAPQAAQADALATAFYLHSPEWIQRYCRANPSIGVLLSRPTGRAGQVELLTFNIDPADVRQMDTRQTDSSGPADG